MTYEQGVSMVESLRHVDEMLSLSRVAIEYVFLAICAVLFFTIFNALAGNKK